MEFLDFFADAGLIGIGATLVMDVVGQLQFRLLATPQLDYALVGRWAIWIPKGRFYHRTIVQSARQPLERPVGWALHYAIGIIFAALMLGVTGPGWTADPTLCAALVTGVLSLSAPFLLMQPAFGFGFAASQTPRPWISRMRSLIAHLSFGLGLYLAGEGLRAMRQLAANAP